MRLFISELRPFSWKEPSRHAKKSSPTPLCTVEAPSASNSPSAHGWNHSDTVIYTDENFVMDKNIDINIEIHFDNDNSNATDNNYNSGNDNNNITNKNNNKMTMLVILCLSIIIHCKKQWKWAAFANLAMVYIQWSQCKIMKVFPFPRCQIFACDL